MAVQHCRRDELFEGPIGPRNLSRSLHAQQLGRGSPGLQPEDGLRRAERDGLRAGQHSHAG
jgi:hypothetical protein